MEDRKAFIRFCKAPGKFGPGQVLEPNKIFVIGSDRDCDIRMRNTNKIVKHVFKLNEEGLVTVTDETDNNSPIKVFVASESFQIEGKTFIIEYLKSELVPSSKVPKKLRMSCFPTTRGGHKIDPQALTDTSDLSTNYGSISMPRTPIPVRIIPSARRSSMYRQSMAPLPEDDENNSNDSRYKTPENPTSGLKVIMRSHKSTVKSNLDEEGTPKCVTPQSNTKSRRSLILRTETDANSTPHVSPNTSDDDSDDKCGLTITTTSDSGSGVELQTSIDETLNEEEVAVEDTNDNKRQPAKRMRDNVDSDDSDGIDGDSGRQDAMEPPSKRMRRESIYSFRDRRTPSARKSLKENISAHSAKLLRYSSNLASPLSFANMSTTLTKTPSSLVAPNTVPRMKRTRRNASSSRQSLNLVPCGSTDNNEEIHSFDDYASNTPSPLPKPKLFPFETNEDNDTTHSSSFSYVHGKDPELSSLGMSVFYVEENDSENFEGDDLIEFSRIATPIRSSKKNLLLVTPNKETFKSSNVIERRSSRAIKPPQLYSPDRPTVTARTPKKSPAMARTTSLYDLRNQTNASLRRSLRPFTPTSFTDYDVPSFISGKKSRANAKTSKDNSNLSTDMSVESNKSFSISQMPSNFRTPLSPRSVQKNPVIVTSLRSDSPPIDKSANQLRPRTPMPSSNFDSDDSLSDLRKRVLSKSPLNNETNNTSFRTPTKSLKAIDPDPDDSGDSFIENRSTPYPHSKKITKLDKSLSQNKTINSNTPKALFENTSLRRSSRTPKSVFNKNSILDESIFDTSTSTRQSHSLTRSISVGYSSLNEDSLIDARSLSSSKKNSHILRNRSKSFSESKEPLMKTSANDLAALHGVKYIPTTPTVRRVLKNGSTNIQGVGKLLRTPKAQRETKIVLDDLRGVSKLMRTPKVSKEPFNDLNDVRGVKNLLGTPRQIRTPKNDVSDLRGVKNLLGTPRQVNPPKNDLSDLRGVKTMFNTPKIRNEMRDDLRNVQKVEQLLRSAKKQKDPKNDLSDLRGVAKLLKTQKVVKEPLNDLSDVRGVKNLFGTLREVKQPKNDLTEVAGVKRLFGTPKVGKEPNNDLSDVFGIKKMLKTPRAPQRNHVPDFTNTSGVATLFKLQQSDDSDDVSVTSTTSSIVILEKFGNSAQARRRRAESTDQIGDLEIIPNRIRSKRIKVPPAPSLPAAPRGRAKRKAALVKDQMPEPQTETIKPRKRLAKNTIGPATTLQDDEINASTTLKTKKSVSKKHVTKLETPTLAPEIHQVEEVSSTITTKKATSRKRGISTRKVTEEPPEDDVEPIVKRGRGRKKVIQDEDVAEVKSSIAKGRTKRMNMTKIFEEIAEDDIELPPKRARGRKKVAENVVDVEPSAVKERTKRTKKVVSEKVDVSEIIPKTNRGGRKPKAKPVDDVGEGSTVFTAAEEIVDTVPVKAIRVTRARRGRTASVQTEESYDIECGSHIKRVEVNTPRATKTAAKRVKFDSNTRNSPVPAQTAAKRPRSRRLLSEDDIHVMTEVSEVTQVHRSTRKVGRPKK